MAISSYSGCVTSTLSPVDSSLGSVSMWGRRIFMANLVAQIGIVVTGGAVRLTGSGLGCPTWPQCMPGSFTPVFHEANRLHASVEFGNRLLTFVLGILAIAAVIVGIRDAQRRRRHDLPRRRGLLALSATPLIGTLAQAVLGGVTVLTSLHPLTVAAHFMLSMMIIAACVALVMKAREDEDRGVPAVRSEVRWATASLVVVAFAVLVVGTLVTGSGPHAGDATMPERLPFDPRTISWLHADLVVLFIGLTLGVILALRLVNAPRFIQRAAWTLLAVQMAQGVIGYVQYFTGLPELLVGVHMLGAALVWVATVRLHLATTASVPVEQP
jgi:heme a synthase